MAPRNLHLGWSALALAASLTAGVARAQAVADDTVDLSVAKPAYAEGGGPVIAIDGGHNNYHTVDGRYAPFAGLLRNDGFKVVGLTGLITRDALAATRVLVIANALAPQNVEVWDLPTYPAFRPEEVRAVRDWVEGGGSLFLIADHMPFPGAVDELAKAFGFRFDNGFAFQDDRAAPETFSRAKGSLAANEITEGVSQVRSFTGSSFQGPKGAVPVMRLDSGWTLLSPEKDWTFTPTTPSRRATAEDLRIAALEVGRGRVVVASEAAMFSAQVAGGKPAGFAAPGAGQNKQLLLNITRWLAR